MVDIDLCSCIKYLNFEKKKIYTKEELNKHNFTNCVNQINDDNLKIICKILFELVSNMYDLVKFFDIFKENKILDPLIIEINTLFENNIKSNFFKFDLFNLLVFLYKFTDFFTIFIDKINKLLEEVYKNIVLITINNKYFLLHLKGETSIEEININMLIIVFRQSYVNIIKLNEKLFNFTYNKANSLILYNNFNVKFMDNMTKLDDSSKDELNKKFIEYENDLSGKIPEYLSNIEVLIGKKKDEKCKDFYTAIVKLKEESTLSIKVNTFSILLDNFKCIEDNKKDIFENLKNIGFILKSLSVPKIQQQLQIKIDQAFESLTTIQKILDSKKKDYNYIEHLKENLEILKTTINLYISEHEQEKIINELKNFCDSIIPSNITDKDIKTFSNIYINIKKEKDEKKVPIKIILENINKIFNDNIKKKEDFFEQITSFKKKKYKIKNLKLIGGVIYINIDLRKCTKLSYFKEKKLENNFIFDKDTIEKKYIALEKHKIDECLKNIIGRKYDPNLINFCIILLNLVSELDDFVEFIKIFEGNPYNLDTSISKISSLFKLVNLELYFHKLPTFLNDFYIFLETFINEINNLFTNVLSKKSINQKNFIKFKYFSTVLKDITLFHNNTEVNCPIYFNVFRERYKNIFKYIKILSSSLNGDIIKILSEDFELSKKIENLNYIKRRNPILQIEKESRKEIKIIYDSIKELINKVKPGCLIRAELDSFVIDCNNQNKYNDEIINNFINILDNFSCFENNKKDIFKGIIEISNILKKISTKEESINIDEKINKIKREIKYDGTTVVVDDLENKLKELEGNLLFCFNADHKIFQKYTKFKTNLNVLNIEKNKIKELDEINGLLKEFIKGKEKCKAKPNIYSKENLGSELEEIKKILEKKNNILELTKKTEKQ